MKRKLILITSFVIVAITSFWLGIRIAPRLIFNELSHIPEEVLGIKITDEETKEWKEKLTPVLEHIASISMDYENSKEYKDKYPGENKIKDELKKRLAFIKSTSLTKIAEIIKLPEYNSLHYYAKIMIIWKMIASEDINELNFITESMLPKVIEFQKSQNTESCSKSQECVLLSTEQQDYIYGIICASKNIEELKFVTETIVPKYVEFYKSQYFKTSSSQKPDDISETEITE